MTNWARIERKALCDLLLEVGPDVPTLCGSWTSRDLAAHLVIRERRPDTAAGLFLKPLQGWTDRVRRQVAARPWPDLVSTVRSGPPIWSPTRLDAVDRLTNTIEFFVHHEDVRRATEPWSPRPLDTGLDDVLWGALSRMGKLLARKSPVGLSITDTEGGRGTVELKSGSPTVVVSGPPGELVLFLYGRQHHSRVGLVGDEQAAASLTSASFGI